MNTTTTLEAPATFAVLADRISDLLDKVATLAKKAVKLGAPAPVVTVDDKNPIREFTPEGQLSAVRFNVTVDATGLVALPGGWSFRGVAKTEAGIRTVHGHNGTEAPLALREWVDTCDHCHVNRARNTAYAVESAEGELKIVGSTCVVDFLGHVDALRLVELAASLSDILSASTMDEDDCVRGWSGATLVPLVDVIDAALRSVALAGRYIPASFEGGTTKDDVTFQIFPPRRPDRDDIEFAAKLAAVKVTPEQIAAVIALGATISGTSEYAYNLRSIFAAGQEAWIAPRHIGVAASAVSCWLKAQTKAVEATTVETDDFFGTPKAKFSTTATLVAETSYDTQYGTTYVLKFRAASGELLVWKASNPPQLDRGQQVVLSGTVKEHTTYNGKPQTLVTRCKAA